MKMLIFNFIGGEDDGFMVLEKKYPHGPFAHVIGVLISYVSSLCVKQIKLYIP